MSLKWPMIPAKYLLIKQNHPSTDDDGVVTAFRDGEVVLRSARRVEGFTEATEFIGYQGVRTGELVVHSMDAFAGAIGISKSDGRMSPVVHIYKGAENVDLRFYAYYLKHLSSSGYIQSLSKGIRERSTSFDPATLKELIFPFPSIEEQRNIANYLDAQISRIDDILNAKIQQKRILNQEAQARLVEFFGHPHFSGLQSNEQRRLGPCLLLNEGGYWGDDPIGSHDTLVLRSTEITSRGKWRDLENGSYRNLNLDNNKQHLLRLDDIVVTKASGSLDHIGKAALVTQEIVDLGASFGNFMQRLRVNPSIYIPAYIGHFLRSSNARSQFQYWGTTSTGLFNVSAELLNNLQLPVVSLSEQERVSSIIEELEIDFEARLSLIEKSITLFEKLKNSTISEAVVGKLDSQTSKGASNV